MKRRVPLPSAGVLALSLVLVLALAWAGPVPAQKAAPGRGVHGVVLDAHDQPVAHAIVYLKNLRTKDIRSYIADNSGHYEFHDLQLNTDYELHAEIDKRQGPTRLDSAYNSAADLNLDLKLP